MSFPFTSSSFAAFVVRCTLVTPVYPPQQPSCRLLALVGHFWRLLPRRRQHTSATSPDLLNRFCTSTAILPYCHCICCCPSYHWLCLFTSNASCHGKQTLQFLHCLSAEQLRSQQETLSASTLRRDTLFGQLSLFSAAALLRLSPWSSAAAEGHPRFTTSASKNSFSHGHIQQLFARHARCCALVARLYS